LQKWPVRKSRSLKQKESVSIPLTTGQRIIDTMFPLAKGGSACVPGPFGAGKTVIQHQLAKWADADIIVFVGCGERGNEMTDVLQEFPELKDPRTGKPLLERTILIANTSNMPIAAREASVYTGAAIAEYFRDMGYSVALMADSTSRWAEALREMSGRLEEMPGEEGYPAYLSSRLADFYERSGYGKCLGTPEREGSLTIIGSVSPPGGDFSEPVVQNTLRVTKVFWGLDYALAHKRHFPAINWLQSYSLYVENLSKYFKENIGEDFPAIREEALRLLAKEAELEEIVRLVGMESLSQKEQLILFVCKIIREDFLYQSAFDPIDQFSSLKKQYNILSLIMILHKKSLEILDFGVEVKDIQKIDTISRISKLKLTKEEEIPQEAESIRQDMKNKMENLIGRANNE
ncbi:V-type ATP synthase subunit A, partial [candidate division WOR-1 bacterium RIFOXYA2_FULL_37_7]